MLEQWNIGFWETAAVVIGKTLLTRKLINERLPCKFIIPTFQYSIIPGAR